MIALKRFLTLLSARNKEFIRDTSALAWNLLFPVFIIIGFAFAFSSRGQTLFKVAQIGKPSQAFAFLDTKYVEFVPYTSRDEALKKLGHHQIDFVLDFSKGDSIEYALNESNPKSYLVEKLFDPSHSAITAKKLSITGDEIRYVDWLIAGVLGMNMMFSALFGVGYTIVRYRKNGVLKRLKATPLSAFEFLSAQIMSRMILILSVGIVVFFGTNQVVHFRMQGSYFNFFFIQFLGAFALISLSLLVCARVKSEEFAGGVLNLVSWPMMFFSGVWFSLEGTPVWLQNSAKVFPLTHMINASRAILTEGATLSQVAPEIGILVGMSAFFLILGASLFRWE